MIAIGADHGGYELKKKIIEHYEGKIDFKDFGTFSNGIVHFPEYAKKVCDSVVSGECEYGILICRTGVGMSIAANKVKGIACALCYNPKIGKICKEHNNANVIALPADVISDEEAIETIDNWLDSTFLGGRYQIRVDMIKDME